MVGSDISDMCSYFPTTICFTLLITETNRTVRKRDTGSSYSNIVYSSNTMFPTITADYFYEKDIVARPAPYY